MAALSIVGDAGLHYEYAIGQAVVADDLAQAARPLAEIGWRDRKWGVRLKQVGAFVRIAAAGVPAQGMIRRPLYGIDGSLAPRPRMAGLS